MPRPIHPDLIRSTPQNPGCGPHQSFRHLHHQRGTIGTFHVRLLEGSGLKREHWSALSLVPGLSYARGEVSSFGTVRLAFWKDENESEEHVGAEGSVGGSSKGKMLDERKQSSLSTDSMTQSSSSGFPQNNVSGAQARGNFLPSMPPRPNTAPSSVSASNSATPLTPFDGCLASMSPARSPFFPAFAQQQSQRHNAKAVEESKPFNKQPDPFPLPDDLKKPSTIMPEPEPATPAFIPPHHYAKESYRSSVIHNDSNPIWGDANMISNNSSHSDNGGSNFRIPLKKEDLFPALKADGARVALEVRLDEEMAATESFLVGGALSHAVGAATAATSLVPVVGKSVSGHAQKAATAGREMIGLGTDRLIGRGYIDLMPLLLGLWEEEFKENHGNHADLEGDDEVDEYGRLDAKAYVKKKRVGKLGLLDVWVPLRRQSNQNNENHGKVHLLISYEPNGMQPKQHDIVALESFARRPYSDNVSLSGPVITPTIPPLYPLLVVQTSHNHLLVEYTSSRTVTSVDRNGNVKSSKWSRSNRVRIHRNSAFVIERRTLMDAVGDVARLPGDIVLSTSVGQEIADATAPIVAASMELLGPALLWGKLMMSAGGTGVRAGMAGLRAATEAVVSTSNDMARSQRYERRGDEGVYSYGS